MFREFILLMCSTLYISVAYRIEFDMDLSPPTTIPTVKDMFYSVPLNQTISKPIIAYIRNSDGSRVWSGAFSNDVYNVTSVDAGWAYNKTLSDTWKDSGGKLCQQAVWWEDYPIRFDTSLAKSRCGDATSPTTLSTRAFNGRIILDGIFHQHHDVANYTRIIRITHPSGNIEGDTHAFKITRPARYVAVDVQPPLQVFANEDFSITVKIRDNDVAEVDTGLDSSAIVQLSIPNTLKTFYNTEENAMMLKSTGIRLGGRETIMHQSNRDTVIRKVAIAGIAKFEFIRILDPVKDIKLNVTMIKPRPCYSRIPKCKKCNDDFAYRNYLGNGTKFTFLPMSKEFRKRIKSLVFTAPITVLQQAIDHIGFSKKTIDLWVKWTDSATKTVSVINNVKIPGEIFLEAFDKKGQRIFAGNDANFTLKYETIPSGICISKDVTKIVERGAAHLTLSFCQIVKEVQLAISVEGKPALSVKTVNFKVVGTINVAHIGDFRNKESNTDYAAYMNSFLHFASQDINKGIIFKNLLQAGFNINLTSYNTMNDADIAFSQLSKIIDSQSPPSSRIQMVFISASDEIAKVMNVQLLRTKTPSISTSNIDTEFSDKFVYPFFNRICWSERSIWKSFAMAARDRNWYKLVVLRTEVEKISESFFNILAEKGIIVVKEIILPVIGSQIKSFHENRIFAEQMKTIKEYMCKVIVLFAERESQPFILDYAHLNRIDDDNGYQWVLLSEYVGKYPFKYDKSCLKEFVPCIDFFKCTYFMIESYNVSGFTGENWTRVLNHYYSVNENELFGGRIDHAPLKSGGKVALGYDAMMVFVNAFLKIVLKNETVSAYSITQVIHQSDLEGLTGNIRLDINGDRTGYLGIIAQINEELSLSDTEEPIKYTRLLQTLSDDVQLEIPFALPNTLYANIAKLLVPPSHTYNMITFNSLTALVSPTNQSFIPHPCEVWPPTEYLRVEKVIPIYTCDTKCGFKLLSDSNVNDYDTGVCVEGNQCQCKPGYAGSTCTKIVCKCVHGVCLKPYNCTCDTGWFGDSCNKAACKKCVHGKCVAPDDCECDSPWTGCACDVNAFAILIPLLLVLIVLVILACFLICRFVQNRRNHEVMYTNNWIVDWNTVERCSPPENYMTWVVISSSIKATSFTPTYKWKESKWYVKKISSTTIPLSNIDFRREMVTLINIKHRNLVTFGGACITEPHVSLFLPVADRGSLHDLLKLEIIEFSWDVRYSFMKDICSGMDYLHQKTGIGSHGRLNSHNCLVDYRWTIRISGYGAPTLRYGQYRNKKDVTEDVKIFFWTAPELLQNIVNIDDVKIGSKPGDVYAFAIVVAEILTRDDPYAYELNYISERSLIGLIQDYNSPALKNSRVKWRELAGPTMWFPRPILTKYKLGFNMKHRNIIRHMLADAWGQVAALRPTFRNLLNILDNINQIKMGWTENQIKLLVTYTKNLEVILMERVLELCASTEKYEHFISELVPRKYAAEIKQGRVVSPEYFECVTIFASDLPDFNRICQISTARQMVNCLNEIFHFFEETILGYNVYKLDTNNECHLIVGGLDGNVGTHSASEIATMALDLMTSISTFTITHKPEFKLHLRVGIHSGPAVAGVVGRSTPKFCVLGKTTSVALNILLTSEPLHIQVSTATAMILQNLQGFDLQCLIQNDRIESYWLWGKHNFKSIRDLQ